MKCGYEFVLTATYDKAAYQALSEASWVLFRKRKMQSTAYPALFTLAFVIAVLMIYNWGSYSTPILIGGIAFIVLQFAVIPLGAMSAKAKMCRTAIKEAQKQGQFPVHIQFVFSDKQIHATIGEETTSVPYTSVDCLISLGEWRLLFFGRAAYILHTSCFSSHEELERFQAFITEKCDLPFNQMKGAGPKR